MTVNHDRPDGPKKGVFMGGRGVLAAGDNAKLCLVGTKHTCWSMTVESSSLAQPISVLCFGRHLNECFQLDNLTVSNLAGNNIWLAISCP